MNTIRKPVVPPLIQMCENNIKSLMFKDLALSSYSLMLILFIFLNIRNAVLNLILSKYYSL